MHIQCHIVSADELAAILTVQADSRPAVGWVRRLRQTGEVETLSDEDLVDLASEPHPRGPRAAIDALIGLARVRLQGDRLGLAALCAIQHYHLPNAIETAHGL